ncbi:MAG: hypothetical protein NTZ72_14095 [Afipia sp.]|nr:hypothetical protein [Afipia sp.]
MAYFRPSQERLFTAKRFLTEREVEDLAAAGAREIVQVNGLVITDAAKEKAHDLGLVIKQPQTPPESESRNQPPQVSVPSEAAAASRNNPTAPTKITAKEVNSLATQSRRVIAEDPLLQAVVDAIRSNRRKLAAIAKGD